MKNLIIIHFIIYVLIIAGIIFIYNQYIWKGVKPEEVKTEITATATQNTISTGVTAVSILLPLTVGLLGFIIIKSPKSGSVSLLCACLFFTVSLAIALWNLNRLPSIVNVYNLANDKKTVFLMMIQLFSLLWGVIYLTIGAFRIIINFRNGG